MCLLTKVIRNKNKLLSLTCATFCIRCSNLTTINTHLRYGMICSIPNENFFLWTDYSTVTVYWTVIMKWIFSLVDISRCTDHDSVMADLNKKNIEVTKDNVYYLGYLHMMSSWGLMVGLALYDNIWYEQPLCNTVGSF